MSLSVEDIALIIHHEKMIENHHSISEKLLVYDYILIDNNVAFVTNVHELLGFNYYYLKDSPQNLKYFRYLNQKSFLEIIPCFYKTHKV